MELPKGNSAHTRYNARSIQHTYTLGQGEHRYASFMADEHFRRQNDPTPRSLSGYGGGSAHR